jgi:hypothetical protein
VDTQDALHASIAGIQAKLERDGDEPATVWSETFGGSTVHAHIELEDGTEYRVEVRRITTR